VELGGEGPQFSKLNLISDRLRGNKLSSLLESGTSENRSASQAGVEGVEGHCGQKFLVSLRSSPAFKSQNALRLLTHARRIQTKAATADPFIPLGMHRFGMRRKRRCAGSFARR
jgi:hypothetical protein